jgi:2-dehydro-3-deoxy-D-arabinonate dehydratase
MPGKVVGPGTPAAIRKDSHWSVPEAELVLVYNSRGQQVGVTLGNDMSARDIEGANLLYLPQAKIYDRSCAIGPYVVVGPTETEIRTWKMEMDIARQGKWLFRGATALDRLKRSFEELTQWLWTSQSFPQGVMLLTGTGIIPPNEFRLQEGDQVYITVEQIGRLENPIIQV